MLLKNLNRTAVLVIMTLVFTLVIVPSEMASANLKNVGQLHATEYASNTNQSRQEQTATIDDIDNSYENTGCIALAQDELEKEQCLFKNDSCDPCDREIEPSLCRFRRAGQRCVRCSSNNLL